MNTKCLVCGIANFERIRKNGKFNQYLKYKEKNINEYVCLFQNKSIFYEEEIDINNSKDENLKKIKYKLEKYIYENNIIKIFNKLVKFKYYISFYDKKNYIYLQKNINKLCQYLYLIKNEYNFKSKKNFIKKLAIVFKLNKLRYPKLNNMNLYIQIFYSYYVISLIDKVYKKYKINLINDFDNYHEVYKFLKKKGYVLKYYNEIIPKIRIKTKNINKLLKKNNIIIEVNKIKNKIQKNEVIFA